MARCSQTENPLPAEYDCTNQDDQQEDAEVDGHRRELGAVTTATTCGACGPEPSSSGYGLPPQCDPGGQELSNHTTAIHRTWAGGLGRSQWTVHRPSLEGAVYGETNHGPDALLFSAPITKISDWPDGKLRAIPANTYRLPGGGGKGCSDKEVIAITVCDTELDAELDAEGLGEGPPPPQSPSRATTTLATAVTAAASNTCHRSRRLFLARALAIFQLSSKSHALPTTAATTTWPGAICVLCDRMELRSRVP